MEKQIPTYVHSALWSYDVDRMQLQRDKNTIITNVLNYGTKPATDWLFGVYSKADISDIVKSPRPGIWDKKSLNYWSIVLDVVPELRTRF